VRSTAEPANDWPHIAVVGAGAVGAYFGARLARAGAPVVMVGRKPFVDAVERSGLTVEGGSEPLHVRVPVSTDLSACRAAQLVLFCVKTVDTVSTARALEPHLSADTVLLTMQNGVEGAEQIRASIHRDAIAAAVYVAVAMREPARVRHYGRGDLVVGADAAARQVASLCARAAIQCRVTDNLEGELWSKLLMNCALNALSALGRSDYAHIMACPPARSLIEAVVSEVLDVARAAGVKLPSLTNTAEAMAAVARLVAQMPAQHSSTALDLDRGRRTEIDALNGFVQRRGSELGVATPANQALFALVRLAETARANGGAA
jgi:2-dehydropantoate 2-reductase